MRSRRLDATQTLRQLVYDYEHQQWQRLPLKRRIQIKSGQAARTLKNTQPNRRPL